MGPGILSDDIGDGVRSLARERIVFDLALVRPDVEQGLGLE